MFLSETRTLLSKLAAFRARTDASHHCLFVSLWITTNTTVYVHSVLLYSIDPLFNPTMAFQCFMSLPHFSFNRALLTFQYQQRFLLIFFKPKELSKDATQSQMIQRECKRHWPTEQLSDKRCETLWPSLIDFAVLSIVIFFNISTP